MPRTRKPKLTPPQIARKAERDALLVRVGEAIREGRAFLDTFDGRKRVVGYNDATGWATTNAGSSYLSQQSFMICVESIKIVDA